MSTTHKGGVRLVCALLLLFGIASAVQAQHIKSDEPRRARSAGSVKFLPGTQESDAARAQRLRRECKGRPNAGACLGHAS